MNEEITAREVPTAIEVELVVLGINKYYPVRERLEMVLF